jgi:hypothetical protein
MGPVCFDCSTRGTYQLGGLRAIADREQSEFVKRAIPRKRKENNTGIGKERSKDRIKYAVSRSSLRKSSSQLLRDE